MHSFIASAVAADPCTHMFSVVVLPPCSDYSWDFAAPKDPEVMKAKVDSELLNGRLAMCAIGGIATQSVISGHGFPYV